MTGYMTHEEVSELLGAFALDAVEVDDDVAIREHLASCVRCESEVAQFHEVAGLLANTGGDAPQHLWDRIALEVGDGAAAAAAAASARAPTLSPTPVVELFSAPSSARTLPICALRPGLPAPPAPCRTRRWGQTGLRFVVPFATAAALIVIAVLGLQIERMNHRIGQLDAASANQGLAQALQAALLNPQAKQIELGGSRSTDLAELVVLPSGTGFLINHELPVLASSETYQLWGLAGGRLISVGLLGNRPTDVAMTIGQPASFASYAVTVENAGGSVSPTLPPVATSATLST